jgi:hypothetical protein
MASTAYTHKHHQHHQHHDRHISLTKLGVIGATVALWAGVIVSLSAIIAR